ncbi:MAG: multiple sugar transport system ATP-binding protein [Gaiellales bacterium]|jgi:multiple sugar transport system ATP-binding protein|nr:multiple sugar transport system ATP-binding protein [Gaiellales bacterium]
MASVTFSKVTKRFPGGTVAVDALDLEIPDGELVVLVGPSGCGKSTALRMVAGLDEPSEGRIAIGDRDVDGVSPAARDVAMVFQSYALYPHMTVAKNLAFPLERRHMPRADIKRRVAEVSEMLGLQELLRRKPSQLSGGQRQRVAMGRALAREPAVFLLDEPLSNLDAKLRSELRAELKRLHAQVGTTMVYVTHDQVEAMTLGSRIAVLDKGRLQQFSTPDEVYRHPRNLFVARFVGSPAMNIVPGETVGLAADVVAGVRPEALRPAGEVDGGIPIALVAEVVEPLGSDVYVHGHHAGQAMVARLPGSAKVTPGERLDLAIDRGDLHLFDAESGERKAG